MQVLSVWTRYLFFHYEYYFSEWRTLRFLHLNNQSVNNVFMVENNSAFHSSRKNTSKEINIYMNRIFDK